MGSAMAGWGDLAPLIIFAIISIYVNNKRKKAEAEAKSGQAGSKPQAQAAPADRSLPMRPAPKPVPDDGEDEEDWTGEAWDGEHSERWDDHQGSEQRTIENRAGENRTESISSQPKDSRTAGSARQADLQRNIPSDRADKAPAIPSKAKEKAAEVGKDLLNQLAKELGLELPQQGRPAPAQPQAPKPSGPQPVPASAPSRTIPAATAGLASPDEIRNRNLEADRARPGTLYSHRAPQSALPSGKVPTLIPGLAAGDLTDPESLRRAFILKTVLDRPVSMKRRG